MLIGKNAISTEKANLIDLCVMFQVQRDSRGRARYSRLHFRSGYRSRASVQSDGQPQCRPHHERKRTMVLDILGTDQSGASRSRLTQVICCQVGAILCAVTLAINVLYVLLERRLPDEARVVTGRQIYKRQIQKEEMRLGSGIAEPSRPFSKKHLRTITISLLAIPASFWLITMTQIGQAGTVMAYSSNLSEVSRRTDFQRSLQR